MGDDGVADAVVESNGDDAVVEEILFGAVGAIVEDAIGPDGSDAGEGHELIERGMVDVDGRVLGMRGYGAFGLGQDGGRGAEHECEREKPARHGRILPCVAPGLRQLASVSLVRSMR